MKKILGLIITFNPSTDFSSNLKIILDQVDHVLVVDNGSALSIRCSLEQETLGKKAKITILYNNDNLGIAKALNQGFQWAISQGYDYLITFDQDSYPSSDMVAELLRVYAIYPPSEIAILAPQIQDSISSEKIEYLRLRNNFLIERVRCNGNQIDDVLLVVTSGSLSNLLIYQKLGAFREDFFIDYVDTEYCLRAHQHGYKITVACKATLYHRLGEQKKQQIGKFTLRPTFHSPLRWYYIHRNRIAMCRLYAFKLPAWALYDLATGFYAFLKMLFYEDRKFRKILAVAAGIFDGIFGRMGPISSDRKILIVGKE